MFFWVIIIDNIFELFGKGRLWSLPFFSATASWQDKDFGSKVTRFVDVGNVYKIYINNYKVQSVVFAESDGNKYVGSYPATTDEVNASTKQPLAADSKNFTADKIK